MTNADKKVPFTLRMKKELSEKIQKEAKSRGISKNAYINQILHKVAKEEVS